MNLTRRIFSILIVVVVLFGGFIAKPAPTKASENELINFWSYVGGSMGELPDTTLIDENYVYLMGWSDSIDIDKAVNTLPNPNDSFILHSFVSCMEKKTGKLIYSVYINGEDTDWGEEMIMDKEFIYMVGKTGSRKLPKASNSIHNKENSHSRWDGFITKIKKSNGEIIYSTYIGDQYEDEAIKVIDADNKLLVFGYSDTKEEEWLYGPQTDDAFYSVIDKKPR